MKIVESWTGPGRRDAEIRPVGPEGNAAHLDDHKLAFEHWYFDARLDDGHIVVGFIQTRELIQRKPGVELHVYRPDGTRLEVIKHYTDEESSASREQCDVQVGDNWAKAEFPEDGLPVHRLHLSEGDLTFDLTFENEVPTWMPGGGSTTYGDRDYFAWCVGAPRARVSGTVRIADETIKASGIGYHDHNWGVGDMKRIIDHWYWGRLYTDDLTVIYANVHTTRRYGAHSSMPLMMARGSEIVLSTGEVYATEGPKVFDKVANRDYPSTLSLDSDEVDLTFTVRRIVHANDFLDAIPVVRSRFVKPVVNRFLGRPGYFRFESDYDLIVRLQDEVLKETGRTMHEMVALH
jgi:hypothetical protein